MVTIELENKRKATVPVATLSEADQQYIRKWALLEAIRSESAFKTSIERRKVKSWTEKHYGCFFAWGGDCRGTQFVLRRMYNKAGFDCKGERRLSSQMTGKSKHEEAVFEITFFNRNAFSIRDLILEYCIHYKQEVRDDQDAQPGILFGCIPIEEMAPFSKRTICTDSVCVYKYAARGRFVDTYELQGEVVGLIMRLYLVADGEQILVREERFPNSLSSSYAWDSWSSPVGKN